MMKVVLVTPGWPPSSFANGIATYVGHLHEGFAKLDVESRVLAQELGDGEIGSDIVDLARLRSPAGLVERIRGAYARLVSRYDSQTWTSTVRKGRPSEFGGRQTVSSRFSFGSRAKPR